MQQAACLSQGGDCSEIAQEIEKKEQRAEQRALERVSRCPKGFIEYCDQTMKGCGTKLRKRSDEFYCVPPQDLRDAIKW